VHERTQLVTDPSIARLVAEPAMGRLVAEPSIDRLVADPSACRLNTEPSVARRDTDPSVCRLKRTLDLLGAMMLLIIGAPLLILAAVAIRLESSGPVFFRQTRVGRDGRPFRIVKLRTMVVGADDLKESLRQFNEATGLFKIADDPRITRVGRVLRKTCIDELPQLFNVLGGEMSLVGPRPLIPEEDRQIVGVHRARLRTAPGITGHWQILGHARAPLHEMVAIDCSYVDTWTMWSDIKILLRTVPHVVARRGL
jgi:lipopolysaccharide/colanic/teichoic acid biosynthesis glycosyltransferase